MSLTRLVVPFIPIKPHNHFQNQFPLSFLRQLILFLVWQFLYLSSIMPSHQGFFQLLVPLSSIQTTCNLIYHIFSNYLLPSFLSIYLLESLSILQFSSSSPLSCFCPFGIPSYLIVCISSCFLISGYGPKFCLVYFKYGLTQSQCRLPFSAPFL